MAKETKAQVKVAVGVESLWKVMTKDLKTVVPKIAPNIVESVQIIEGDGGLGSLYLFLVRLEPDVAASRKLQKEKVVEMDESVYRFGLQVIEGPRLSRGSFSSLTTTFQLSSVGEKESLVDVKVVYETQREDEATIQNMAIQPALNFIQALEKLILEFAL